MGSPLMVWLVLVPAEAAWRAAAVPVVRAGFARRRRAAGAGQHSERPICRRSRLPTWRAVAIALCRAVLAALVQAVLIAAAAQDRQRAADLAAAEGAAMYRFLADNAMDLITRHAPDGRIRFASPASPALCWAGRRRELEGEMPAALAHPDDLGRSCRRRSWKRPISAAPARPKCG